MLFKPRKTWSILISLIFWYTNAYGMPHGSKSPVACDLIKAKKMIVDVIPGQERVAEKILIQCVRENPKNLDVILELSKLIEKQVSAGEKPVYEIKKSLLLATQAYDLNPFDPRTEYHMAHLLETIGQTEEAQKLIQNTMNEFPLAKETLIEKARISLKKDPNESLNLIKKSVKMGTSVDDILELIYSYVRYESDYNTYSKNLKIIADEFQNRWIFHKLGQVYLDEKKYTQAAVAFQKATELGNKYESKLQLSIVQYQNLKQFSQSVHNLENLIQEIQHDRSISENSLVLVYSHYAIALFENKNENKSLKTILNIVHNHPNSQNIIKSLVYELKERNAVQILKPLLQAEIILNPKNDSYYALLGSIYYENTYYSKALDKYNLALDISNGNPLYLYNKACILALTGKNYDAIKLLKIVFSIDFNYVAKAKKDSDFESLTLDTNLSQEFAAMLNQNNYDKWATTDLNPTLLP